MQETDDAYLHGNVVNTFGNPVPGAQLNACGVTAVADDQGIFDMQVEASCTTLEISQDFYASASEPLSLTAGLESLLPDLILEFKLPLYIAGGGDRVASRVIDMSTGGMLPDAPADAGFALNQLYELFQDEFWIDYRILIFYGCYEYNLSAAYSGAPGDYRLEFVQVNIKPKTLFVDRNAILISTTRANSGVCKIYISDSAPPLIQPPIEPVENASTYLPLIHKERLGRKITF